ncbi:MAG: zinc-binding protein [Gammaproteobacteria bacterium]|nr:zinc-binding protein [Gammaproteobacteria bacterium]
MTRHASCRDLLPVYACSGCSSAAQAANQIALVLDRAGIAGVAPLVELARSGHAIIALDGCALNGARHCFAQRSLAPDVHLGLQARGVKKRYPADFDREHADRIAGEVGERARKPVQQAAAGPDCAPADTPQKCGLSGSAS